MEFANKIHYLSKKGIIIYPTISKKKFAVTIKDKHNLVFKQTLTNGEYKHTTKTINEAIIKSIEYVYDKLKEY